MPTKNKPKQPANADPDRIPVTELDKQKKAEKKAKKISCLDAAAQVLRAEGKPMNCKAMIDAIFAKKLWITDAPTPVATLSSAIQREIKTKKDVSRFKKTERGLFIINA